MGTPYSKVAGRFLDKIKSDKKFFTYKGLTEEEINEVVKKRTNYLLDNAVIELEFKRNPIHDISFIDKNDDLEEFNFNLTLLEEDLISDLMVAKYYEEQLAGVNKRADFVGEQGKTLFSLSADRKTLMDLVAFTYNNFDIKLDEYNGRDRITNSNIYMNKYGDYNE